VSNRSSLYTVEGGKLIRNNEVCPQCGPGIFMAKHADRTTCGRCGHDSSKSKVIPEPVSTDSQASELPVKDSSEEE